MSFILLALFTSLTAGAYSPGEGLYGPEFTFTHNGEVPTAVKYRFINHLREHLTVNQPEGARFTEDYDGEDPVFRSPNGWWFRVSDNPGVLEIQMKPMTLADIRRFKSDIQDAIFASAAAVELFPWDYLGGGHINIDDKIFGGNYLLARNFVVDFWNHSELSMGILNFDTHNAIPLALYQPEAVEQINAILKKYDTQEFADNADKVGMFLREINHVQADVPTYLGPARKSKHHDLNFSHFGRVEIRSVRPQTNMDVWLNQIELIESRIRNHLKPMTQPIPLKFLVPPRFPLNMTDAPDGILLTPPVNPQRALKAFHRYVTESGLKWSNHRNYIWPQWVKDGELEKFEKSLSCEKILVLEEAG